MTKDELLIKLDIEERLRPMAKATIIEFNAKPSGIEIVNDLFIKITLDKPT